ncbi:MAG TPA: N-carbamoylputrescine amidase [Steroidobacteraceae bacterium]|nr:N-carbamoylputrescine amidase [Steroidobacteraceae bacterium]
MKSGSAEGEVVVAATQFACSWKLAANLDNAERLVRAAAAQGAQLVLLQELFATPYFCIEQDPAHLELAETAAGSKLLQRFSALARELGVVLPVSFFERGNNAYFNSVAIIDADGRNLGLYRKTHIPDGPGYQEKFYFSPGDTGFRVWDTQVGRIGVGICWDQWFPESARIMALMGAEMLLFPTAIGSEPPPAPPVDSRRHWQRVQQGHAAANLMPLIASNRIGVERPRRNPEQSHIRFYGSSFIADQTGALLAEAGDSEEAVLVARFDRQEMRRRRDGWFLFRDRRPETYSAVGTLTGAAQASI